MWLGPQNLIAASSSGAVLATLEGDLVNYQADLQLNSKFLLIPGTPGNSRTKEGAENYLLVDQFLFTLDGSECNKIGVSYGAFRNQVNPCTRSPGTCLANQPDDYYKADIAARNLGVAGKYFASNFGKVDIMDASGGANNIQNDPALNYLAFMDTVTSRSLITLTLSADNITFVVNTAGGKIISVTLPTFEAESKNGLLTVIVLSTGSINSQFSLSVTQCSYGIAPVLAQTFTILAAQNVTISFNILSELILAASDQCTRMIAFFLFDLRSDALQFNWSGAANLYSLF